MAQILDSLPQQHSDKILCCYVNATSQIQIARITNVPNWYFERVVFPGQRLMFESVAEAQLEIHTGMMATAILSDTISCKELEIQNSEVTPEAEVLGTFRPATEFRLENNIIAMSIPVGALA